MRIARVWLLGLAVLMLPTLASAASLEKGASLLAIQLTRGGADLTGDVGGALATFQRGEVGLQGQYWYFLAKEYAVTVAAGIGYFKESETADPASLGATDLTLSSSSWQFRVGGDRFAQLTDKLQVFAGPGIQMWGGKAKAEDPNGEFEGASTSRFALNGRIGATILMGQNFGLTGHIGQYWGYATASEGAMETKWLPSGSEGAMGFSFAF
jgi:hypothetical protein